MTETAHLRTEIPGYRHLSASSCPRALVGGRHLDGQCWCAVRLHDHGGTYLSTRDREMVVIWQPHAAFGEDLAPVLAGAETDGLAVHITGQSSRLPGSTFSITFSADVPPDCA